MFKNVISSLNGMAGHANQIDLRGTEIVGAEDEPEVQAKRVAQVEHANHHKGHHQAGGKKGHKKRFSSMMNRLQRATIGGKKSVTGGNASEDDDEEEVERFKRRDRENNEIGYDDAQEHEDDNEDDDDEEYKSATEEAYRKLSMNEPSGGVPSAKYDNQTSKKQMQLQQSKQRPSVAGSEKYVLPEEQCDIPTFLHTQNCDRQLIDETRRLLKERYAKNPDNFYDADYERMLTDDWTVSRFLLRRRLDPKRTAKLMEECGRFRKQYKMSEVELWEFPIEFHKAGGLFQYARDRVGNVTMYMRVKMYRRVPEISDVFKAFILCVLERCDVTNEGRGTAVIFDLSGCGLQNVDLGFLSWLLSSFRNYCPKGVSYILVYNLPWILNATCKLAMTWMSASNKRALRFVYGTEIENFIPRENLPDYMGGQCKMNYRRVPAGSLPATEVCHRFDLTPQQALKIAELFKEYLSDEGVEYEQEPDEKNIKQRQEWQRQQKLVSDTSKTPYGELAKTLSEMNQTSATAGLDGDEQERRDSATNGRGPAVVDLVSQATKFIAH